jgi:predicted dinucleotide-binding enzyme
LKIAIIGSGKIGGTAAKLFAATGHEVAIGNSRGPASLTSLVGEIGSHARAATVEDAAGFGKVVLVAIPFGKYRTLPAAALSGKVVIDAMNYYPERDGQIDLSTLTSSELVARYLAGARVVKAFNTMYFETLAGQGRPGRPIDDRLVLFLAGDDADAKAIVSHLIEEIGFAPIDSGSLSNGGRLQQPGSAIYNRPMNAGEARAALGRLRQ